MEFKELIDLISIRNYVAGTINNNPSIDRPTLSELNGMLILTDRKIIEVLKGKEFKDYIGYQGVREAIEEVAKLNNIKSGLKR
jgi:hypothetical protein